MTCTVTRCKSLQVIASVQLLKHGRGNNLLMTKKDELYVETGKSILFNVTSMQNVFNVRVIRLVSTIHVF